MRARAPMCSSTGFQVEWFTGRWAEADELATRALELADLLRDDQYRVIALYARALLDAHLGDVESARSQRRRGAGHRRRAISDALFGVQSRTVRGFLALSQGDAPRRIVNCAPCLSGCIERLARADRSRLVRTRSRR